MRTIFLCILTILLLHAHAALAANRIDVHDEITVDTLQRVVTLLQESDRNYSFESIDPDALPSRPQPTDTKPIYTRGTMEAVAEIELLLQQKLPTDARIKIEALVEKESPDYFLLYLLGETFRLEGNETEARKQYLNSFIHNRRYGPALERLEEEQSFQRMQTVQELGIITQTAPDVILIQYVSTDEEDQPKHYSWISFGMARCIFRFEGYYREVFPEALWYQPSFEELLFSYELMLLTWQRAKETQQNVQDSALDYLTSLKHEGLLTGYVFFHVFPAIIQNTNSHLLEKYREEINRYTDYLIQ